MLNNLFGASFFKYLFSASVAASNIDFAELQLICAERPQLCETHCNKMVKSWAALVNLWLKYVLDLNRTFPDNVHFRKTSNPCMQKSLANVLVAYGHHNPAVGYCQVLSL